MVIKILGKILAVVLICFAVFHFDPKNVNQIIMSLLLFLCGIMIFLGDVESETWRRRNRIITRALLILSIFFIIKVFVID